MNQEMENKISYLIGVKLREFKRNNLSTLTYQQVEDTLYKTKWKGAVPKHLCDIAQDIFSLKVEDVVNFLTKEAITSQYDLENLDKDF